MEQKIIDFLISRDIDIIKYDDNEIITKHVIGNNEVEIKGLISFLRENKLPKYFLCDREKYNLLAHIGWNTKENIGLCCNGSEDVLSLNYKEPEKVYFEGLLKSLELLTHTLNDADENYKQIMDEYLGHLDWVENKAHPKVITMISFLTGINPLHTYLPSHNSRSILITHDEHITNDNYYLKQKIKKQKKQTYSYLIELDELPLPPIPTDNITEWWISLIQKQGHDLIKNLKTQLKSNRSNHFYFICYKKYNDEIITFCISCKNNRKKDFAPLDKNTKNWHISIVKTIQHTKEYLLPRSGGTLDFQGKKVLLVGCGSVGSFISKQLVQSGINKLTLTDPDAFKADNLYRHNLSMSYEGYSKSSGLKCELEYIYPYTNIEAQVIELEKIPKNILIEQDLIIVAIGNPTQERYFNEYLKEENININVIYTWLEGFGLGGHAIYVDKTIKNGCLQCNYLDINEEVPILHSNMNFLYPNQNVAKDIGGCGTLFLPYSHLDSEQTALMTSRLVIDVLSNKINKSVRISWKGPSSDATKEKLKLTHRYHKYSTSKYENYKQEYCYVCS